MSGHSKWSTIKHKKGKLDAKRGKLFTKIIRELTTSAREGGGDAASNARLRSAIAAAKAANMPGDTMQKAIQRGTGELPGVSYEEVYYEAVSYTHLRAHETVLDLVCRLLLEKKKENKTIKKHIELPKEYNQAKHVGD